MSVSLPPLTAVQNFGRRYPGIWDQIDEVRGIGKEFGYQWNDSICYCPIVMAIGALDSRQGLSKREATRLGACVAACAMWRREKRVYKFDPDLADEVLSTADDLVIPTEILYQMPSSCMYIQLSTAPGDSDVDGFFAWVEDDPENKRQELRILYLDADGRMITQYIIHLIPGGTINDGIDAAIKEMQRNAAGAQPESLDRVIEFHEESRHLTIEAVQLVLYVCAANADMHEDEEQRRIYKPGAKVVDKFREVRKWDVGDKLGEQIRIIRGHSGSHRDSDGVSGERAPAGPRKYKNRPHVRRAHWQHYRVGEGRTKLVLKWINTIFVNAEDGEIGVTVQMVEKERKKEDE